MSQADRIRQFALDHCIGPARAAGRSEIAIRAGDVHRGMGLKDGLPAVCSALSSRKFEQLAHATKMSRTGPINGANVYFTFHLGRREAPTRLADLLRFYSLLDQLLQRIGGMRTLHTFDMHHDWPARGLYMFFEPNEGRRETGQGPRVVRVGTHALDSRSGSTLQHRLKQHRGHKSGGGHHRMSIFRTLVGEALLQRGGLGSCASWGFKGNPSKASAALGIDRAEMLEAEAAVEKSVSSYIWAMPFLWMEINDEPGPGSVRAYIVRNAIALLSNYQRAPIDPPSSAWLGHSSSRGFVRYSGLWDIRHVTETNDPPFLDRLAELVELQR